MSSCGEVLIREAFILTMDPARGDLPSADLYIRDGRIAAVGDVPAAHAAEEIDGRGMLVLPGLVETHWHMWTTLLRSMSGDRAEHGYFPTSRSLGAHFTPQDVYIGTLLSAAEAIHSGTTFVHDWCHNVRGPACAEASLRALAEAGVRARFSYGPPANPRGPASVDTRDLARLARRWSDYANGGLLSLGLAWRSPGQGAISDIARTEHEAARGLGLPISVHANNFPSAAGGIAALAREGFLGPELQVIHAIWTTPAEIEALAQSGTAVSLSPFTEMRFGFGMPTTCELLDAGVCVGLSVDTPALSGNADMFGIMKAIQNIANARAHSEYRLPARRVLELATIEGARSMGLQDEIGSLVPGKRADLIMVDTRHINLAVLTEPAHMLVEAVQPANVDTVIIDGRIVKRAGRLTALDAGRIVDEAREANQGLRERAGWW
ncbi:MAG TPA: amidohydrolase family protein [Gammaproteobacteria bacterium]|nr:amidohydrolase family protein [Gammaproteobacteria bacterium]